MGRGSRRTVSVLTLLIVLIASAWGTSLPLAAASEAGEAGSDYRLATPGKFTIGYFTAPGVADVVNGEPTGVGLYLATEIARRLGLEPEYQVYNFAALFPALQSHRIDFIGAQIAGTQPRAQVMWVHQPPTLWGAETLIVRPGTTIESWEDAAAKNLTLASVKGYFQITAWEALGINVHAFDNDDACMTDVLNGGADGCAIGGFSLAYRKVTLPDDPLSGLEQVVVTGPQIVTEGSIFATARDNPELARDIDQLLRDMWRDGTVERAYQSVFGTVDYSAFLAPPVGANYYLLGPWEEGVRPPASEEFPSLSTVTEGSLTVGLTDDTPMLSLDDGVLAGPESEILAYVASRLGLSLVGVRVSDEAAALRDGEVDLVAGQLAATPERTRFFWMTQPVGFSPDYMYVKPDESGSFPALASWEDVQAAGGSIAVESGSPRLADLEASGVDVITFDTAAEGLLAVADGQATAFVGSSVSYAVAAGQDPAIAAAGIGYIRNTNVHTRGDAFGWGVNAGNGVLLDALDQALTLAWQDKVVADAYGDAWPGADINAVAAPGPAIVGTGYGQTKDFVMKGIWMSGAWLQRPGYVQE